MTNVLPELTAVDAFRALAAVLGDHSTLTAHGAAELVRNGAWTLRAPALVLAGLHADVERGRWVRAMSDLALTHDDDPHPRSVQSIVSALSGKGSTLTPEEAAEIAGHVVEGFGSEDAHEPPADLETLLVHLAEIVEDIRTKDDDGWIDDDERLAQAPAQIAACRNRAEVVAVIDSSITAQPGAIPLESGVRLPAFAPRLTAEFGFDGDGVDDPIAHVGPLLYELRKWLDDGDRVQELSSGASG